MDRATLSCRTVQRLLPLYVGDDLPQAMLGPTEAHLLGCARCAAYEDALRRDRERLAVLRADSAREQALPAAVADAEAFWRGLARRLGEAPPGAERAGPGLEPRAGWGQRRLALVLRLGAAAAAVLLAFALYGPGEGGGERRGGPAAEGLRALSPREALLPAAAGGRIADPTGLLRVGGPGLEPEPAEGALGAPARLYPLDGWRAPEEPEREVLSF
ncbi:MAG: hypothetical protein KatS3mg102_1235 [Planctomycetota bacterium]|nr:MAG: hypothetical protein KatS3mg102_1235 [Planctomycetota bacterium]